MKRKSVFKLVPIFLKKSIFIFAIVVVMAILGFADMKVNAEETLRYNSIKYYQLQTYVDGSHEPVLHSPIIDKDISYTDEIYVYHWDNANWEASAGVDSMLIILATGDIYNLGYTNEILYNDHIYYMYTYTKKGPGWGANYKQEMVLENNTTTSTHIRKLVTKPTYNTPSEFVAMHVEDTLSYVEQRKGIITGDNIVDEHFVIHQHYGDSISGGGCYTKELSTSVKHCDTSPSTFPCSYYWDSTNNYCIRCHGTDPSANYHTDYYGECGEIGDISGHYINQITYELECGIDDGATIGNIVMTYDKASDGKYYLNVFASDGIDISKVYWIGRDIGGSSLKDERTKEVTKNTTYTCNVSYTENGIDGSVELSYVVKDYDITPPTVSLSYSDTSWEASKAITISASDEGLGLADNAYRFYNGTSWSSWASTKKYTVNKNGNYSVEVRDKKGLVTKKDFTITHVDSTVPVVTMSYDDETWSATKIISIATAYDNESGLAEKPYRLLNGSHEWTDEKDFLVESNGTYTWQIKNNVGLVNTITVTITHIDMTAPTVTVAYDDNAWTKEKTLSVAASDAETGLATKPYRYSEDGSTWSDWSSNNTYTVTKNGTYYVEVKDNANLVTQKQVTITHIDTTIPNVTLAYDDTNWTKNKTISVTASDTPSGLNNTAYRFYNGTEWGNWVTTNSFTVSQNGTYKIAVRDVANNTNTQTINITHIDNQKPTVTMSCDDSVWTKEKTITITANDSGIGLSATPYRYSEDGSTWSEWSNTNTYTASKNGTYYVQVRDNLGNTESKTLSITHIDVTNPTLSVSYNDTNWEKNKTVTLTASDSQSGLHSQPYRFHDGTSWNSWSTSTSYTITANGTYKLAARDSLGNTQTKTFTITHIDTTVPEATLTYNDTNWEKSKSMTVNASDSESGLHSTAYRFYNGTSWSGWSATKTYTITKNGTYSVEVRDALSNTKKVDFTISKIDNTVPTASVSFDNTTWAKNKVITVNASDSESGLHSTAYRFYNGTSWSSWSATKTYTVTENGSYSVEVRDALSNTKKVDFTISKIDNTVPTASVSFDNNTWEKSKTVTITASDTQSGLHGTAYRFYDGISWSDWSATKVYTVTKNGSYSVEVRDALSNTKKVDFTVSKIDNTIPTASVSFNNTTWEKNKVITVNATDNESGLHSTAYRFNDGTSWSNWSATKAYTVTKNGSYSVEVRDVLSNTKKVDFTVSKIDNTVPTASVSFDNNTWEKSKNITINATDNESGLHSTAYRFYDGTSWSNWSATKTYTITENGSYSVEVRDTLENTKKVDFTVSKIDNVIPAVSVDYNDTNWEKSKNITINATDNESGLHSTAYRFYDGSSWSNWSATKTYTITENGSYSVEVRDSLSNTKKVDFTISKIDNINPTISADYNDIVWEQSKDITINATDNESGLNDKAYSFYNGTIWGEWTTNNVFTVTENGSYEFKVRDALNNTGSISVTITHIDNTAPTVSLIYDDTEWEQEKQIEISASDTQSGLHENAFRFFDGENWSEWTNNKFISIIKNGTYKVEVRDMLENTSSNTFSISHIDTTSPSVELDADESVWTTDKVITVTASDDESGLPEKPYRYSEDDITWSEWVSENIYAVSKNGTYYVEVRNSIGLTTKKEIEIAHIDTICPSVEVIYDSDNWETNKTVQINASDDESGLHSAAYRINDGTSWSEWTNENSYTISKNGTYTVEVRDNANNITSKSFTIDLIDSIKPIISVDFDDTLWELEKEVTINAIDNESGLAEEAYRYSNDGSNWSEWASSNAFTVNNNGHYYVEVRDNVGLTTKIEFTITHIDNEKPVVSIEYDENTITATVTVVVVASDNSSGLHETAYRFHNGTEWSDWTNSNTYTYNKNGTYSIEVRDVLGNTTSESVEIKTIDTTAPDVEIVVDDAIWSFSKTLVVNAVDAGVGLHENPYRYSEDGTNWSEWTANNTYNVEKNGTYYVETRDMLDNSCIKEIEITHVDIENPEVTLIYDSVTWLMTVPVKVEASDNGSGLHETAYRFFNGAEWSDWTKVSEYEITQNGDYKIEVRDRLEQKTCIDFTISNIDDIAPVFDYSVDYFDMKDDTVFVKITNIVENESGLHDEPYSFDGGLTWVSKDNAYLYANDCHTLVVRDKCLNETSMNIALNCIMTADVELLEESDVLVKELYANFKITLNNYTSYTLVRQYQVGALPQRDKWEEIIIDNDKFVEDVLVTTTNSNGLLSRTLTLRVKGNDLDDYMYGVLVRYQNEAGENIQSPLYVYDELYTDSFTVTPLEESIQAGETLYVNDFHKVITYNNNLKRVVLPEDKYMDFITFEDGSLSITPRTVGCYSDSLWVEYKISSAEGCFELDVYDSETPIINSINIDNYEMIDNTSEKEFLFTIDATDNSDGQLYYAILPVGMSTDINYEPSNQISYTFNNNTYANIYVRDESGNTQKELYYVCYIDLNEPVIKSCDVSPDITTPAQNYVVTVTAEDDCTQAADLEYKFVLDGIVIRDYNKDNTCNINQNGELRIFARDKVGREAEYKDTLIFHYADTLAPTISNVSIKSSTNYVLATVFAEDNLSKDLIYGCNSYAFSKTQKENFFTISQSGDYTFFVIDEAGNKVEKTVYINIEEVTSNSSLYSIVRNISVKSLGNTYEYNGDKYTNSGYEVAVTFIKEVDEASTLTSLNGTEYSQTYYYTLDENGTYTLNSRYTAEESEYTGPIVYTNTVTVNGIDKTKPSISITSKNGTAMVNVKDDMSGINKIVIQAKDTDNTTSEKVFTMKNGQLSASRTISIDENKVYQCYAVDNVGNKSKTLAVSSGGIIETETNVKTYNVVFVSEQGGILKIQEVVEGYPATAPEAPEKNKYKFTSWSEDFSEVKRDLYIYPLYERLPVSEVVEPHYDEALRYELIKDTFSFSSKYSGNTLSPVNKLVSNNSYTDETYTFKKFTMPDKKAFSGVMVKEKETILEKIDITNPFVYIPLLILIIIIVVSYLIKRKYTKEY